jgi:molybdopterin synthase catalytic subunit
MTEKHLEKICKDAHQQWDLIETLIIHRIGEIKIADPIVLVCVWSAHRAEAFDACRFMMEDLKSKAPFWKQNTGLRRTPQDNALQHEIDLRYKLEPI